MKLIDFAHRHKEWLKICKYLGAEDELSNDLVQAMYVKIGEIEINEGNLNRLINYNGQINSVYVFKILQNLFINSKKVKELGIDYFNAQEDADHHQEELYQVVSTKLQISITMLSEYEQMLLELHFVHNKSIRKINKETGIGIHSIFYTIKNAKEKIKKLTKTEYQQYTNARNDNQTYLGTWGCDSDDNESDRD